MSLFHKNGTYFFLKCKQYIIKKGTHVHSMSGLLSLKADLSAAVSSF